MASQWLRGAIKTGIGAYADWLLGPGGKYPPFYELKSKSILVCLAPGKTLKEFKSRCDKVRRERPGVRMYRAGLSRRMALDDGDAARGRSASAIGRRA